jgi:integrase/recombinase XerD
MNTSFAIQLFLQSRQSKGLSTETVNWYRRILIIFQKQFPILPESPEDIEAFVASCTAGDETRHGRFRVIRCFYNWLERRRYMSDTWRNPLRIVESPKRSKKFPRPLSLEQLNQLLEYPHKPFIKACLLFFINTGCRPCELHSLKPDSLYLTDYGYIARVTGKTGEHLVPVSDNIYHSIYSYLPIKYSLHRLRRLISFAFKDAHVPGSAYRLRHTFATFFDGDELVLQYIMGHSNLSTTRRYRDIRLQIVCEQHNKHNPLNVLLHSKRLF